MSTTQQSENKENIQQPNHCIIFTNLFPSKADPEQGLFIAQLADSLNTQIDLTVVCPIPWFPKWSFLKKFEEWSVYSDVPKTAHYNNIKVYYPRYLMLPKISALAHPLLIFIGTFQLLKKLFKAKPKSVISAHWIFPDCVAAAIFSKLYGAPLMVTARGCDINLYMQSAVRQPQILFALNQAQKIITVSNALKQKIETDTAHAKKTRTIYNGINRTIFFPRPALPCREKLGLSPDKFILLCVGQLHPVKDHKTLFEGLKIAIEANASLKKKVELVVIGSGPIKDELALLRDHLGLNEHIMFINQVPHNEVATWLSACDLLCLTSIREGRPNIVIEALACGKPVVATRIGGIPELVTHDNGFLFTAGDIDACSTQIDAAFNTCWNSEQIVSTIDHLTWDDCSSQYMELIRDIK